MNRIARSRRRLIAACVLCIVAVSDASAQSGPSRAAMEDAIGGHVGFSLTAAQVADMPICDPATKSGGNLVPYMPTTGAHPEIGVVTGDIVKMIASDLDPHAVASVYSTADCSVNWPVHITDKATGDMPAKPWLNAKQTFTDNASNLLADPRPNPAKLSPDIAHQPHFLSAAAQLALLQNDRPRFARYLVEMKAWVSSNFFHVPVASRGPTGTEGIFDPEASANNPRGAAWGLVALVQLYDAMSLAKSRGVPFVDDGWYAWSKRAVEANVRYFEHKYHLGDYDESYAVPYYARPKGWAKNGLGLLTFPDDSYGRGRDGQTATIGAFQQAFESWSILWLARIAPRLELSGAARAELASLATWTARWPVMMFGDASDPKSWPWQYAGAYAMAVGRWRPDGSVAFFDDGGAAFAATTPLPRPSRNAFLNHDTTDVAGPFSDYLVANIWPALVYAYDMKADGAAAAFARATGSEQWRVGPQIAPAFAYMVAGRSFSAAAQVHHDVTTTVPPASPPRAVAVALPAAPTAVPRTGVAPLAGTGDAAYASLDAIGPDRWGAFVASDTVGRALTANAQATGYREYGADGTPTHGVMAAWSGGDRRKNLFYGVGGSHGDTNFNGVYGVDLESLKARIVVAPSVITPAEMQKIKEHYNAHGGWFTFSQFDFDGSGWFTESTGPFAGRRMAGPQHTYGVPMLDADGTKLVVPPFTYDLKNNAMSRNPAVGGALGFAFDSTSVKWDRFGIGLGFKDAFHYTMIDLDAGTEVANGIVARPQYISGQAAAYIFDKSTYSAAIGDRVYSIRLAPSRDDPVRFPAPQAWFAKLPIPNGGVPVDVVTPTLKHAWSAADMESAQPGTSVVRKGVLYIAAKDWSFFLTWNPANGECGKVTMQGGLPPAKTNGAYGRFMYYEERDAFVLVNDIDEPIYAWRAAS